MAALLASAPAASGSGVAPAAGTLFFSRDGNSELYTIDTSTGDATLVGTTGVTSSTVGLSEGPDDGVLIGSTWQDLSRINADGSGFTAAGTNALLAEGLAWDSANSVLYRTWGGDFTTADPVTGAFVDTSLTDPGEDIEGIAWRDTGEVYAVSNDSDTLFAYDIASDTWSPVGATGIANLNSFGLAWDPGADQLYAINSDGDVFLIDPDTAASVLIGNSGVASGGGLAFLATPAPTASLVPGTPIGEAGGPVTFPVAGICGPGAGNQVSISISGPDGASAGPVDTTTADDGSYEVDLLVDPAPAGTYMITGTCTIVGASTTVLPEGTVVLGADEEPPPSSQGPVAVPADPNFTG